MREGQYGPGTAELEQQIAEHNILQKEIEAYGQQLRNLIGPVRDVHPCLALQPYPHYLSHQILCGPGVRVGAQSAWGVGCHLPCTPTLTELALSPPLVEAGCSYHQEPIPGPPGKQWKGWEWGRAQLPAPLGGGAAFPGTC